MTNNQAKSLKPGAKVSITFGGFDPITIKGTFEHLVMNPSGLAVKARWTTHGGQVILQAWDAQFVDLG
jgi:hypothetical protein